jgi:ATP-dependent Lon protease
VILPAANQKDVEQDVPTEVRAALSFVFVRTLDDALAAAFGDRLPEREARPVLLESRL